ncbi:glycosyltransferase family 2 protein [Paraburkholderia sp. A1RO-5]|uniref:glycosyltransferase family 2 protein n=1 Tax=Paraburkholderia sp. A1RO-5 TaxID=3028369 RepID=UPI003B779ED9
MRMLGGVGGIARRIAAIYREYGLRGLSDRLQRLARAAVGRKAVPLDYGKWLSNNDRMTDMTRRAIRAHMAAFREAQTFSVVMPVHNPDPARLEQAIESVRRQLYPQWQLCIVDDASTDPAIRPILERNAQADGRIHVLFRQERTHICEASNAALASATGGWVVLLGHEDCLSEHALYCCARAIEANSSVQLIYADEDRIDESGRRFAPWFKCDWNIDLFYSQNMVSRLSAYRKSLVDEVGGFRVGFEGAQDYDLVLRYTERIDCAQIHHIPRVLYHRRACREQAAGKMCAESSATLAGARALDEHFIRTGGRAHVEYVGYGYRTRYALPASLPLVTLIVPTRNGLELIRQCIESIRQKTTYPNYEILIVDNGSDDAATLQYFATLADDTSVRILRDDRPFNYSALNNTAVAASRGGIVGLVNNDIEVISPDWLDEMVSYAVQPDIGAVGAKLLYPDGTVQHAGVVTGIGGIAGHIFKHAARTASGYFGRAQLVGSYSAVTAACLLIRKQTYLDVGGLNETDLTVAFNDVDFCLRVREAGYRNVWTPYAELYHHESATRGYEDNPEKLKRFAAEIGYMRARWGHTLDADPAYSPNLTLEREDASLASVARVTALDAIA